MNPEFTAHNIRLDNEVLTKPEQAYSMESHPWFVSAKRILDTVFPGDKSHLRIVDLGCLEGGYAVEFARMGFQVLGLEVREANIAACRYVKANTNLPNLSFVQDDAWNIAKHGTFDAAFCCGLLYHFDRPGQFLKILSSVTHRVVILQTHFATDSSPIRDYFPEFARKILSRLQRVASRAIGTSLTGTDKHNLSRVATHESLQGRWYTEFVSEAAFRDRENTKWASWDNRKSFWIQREYIFQALYDAGFDLVLEQYDCLSPKIADAILHGYYKTDARGMFIGIKTKEPNELARGF